MAKKDSLSKHFTSEVKEVWRSEIQPSPYNPRQITEEGRRQLKRSLRTYGVVGGIIVNKQTNNTIVGGHQKVAILDEMQKYDTVTRDNDYMLRVEFIDIDPKMEKELNITLNNANVGGEWDYEALRKLMPDIDYKNTGLTEEDLSMIGIDYDFKTEDEDLLADALDDMMQPLHEQRTAEREMTQAEKAENIQKVKDAKRKILDGAEDQVMDSQAYVMVNFDTFEAKAEFMNRFGHNAQDKYMKGEYLAKMIDELS